MPDPLDPSRLALDALPEVREFLRRCPEIEVVRYRDGEALIQEGEEGRVLFLVISGSLAITRGGEALATQECTPEAPGIVGEMAYFGARVRTATVKTVGASQVLLLQPDHLDVIMADFPGLTRLLCRQFTWRLQESNDALQGFQHRFDLAPQRRMANEGDVLFRSGDVPKGIIQVVLGSVRLEQDGVSRTVQPHELPEGFLEPEAFLRRRPHRFTATVEGSAFLIEVADDRREAFARSFPGLVLKVLEGKL